LYSVYTKMFACDLIIKQFGHYDREIRQPQYSRSSYAAFLAFLKPRINVEWEKCMNTLIQKLDKHPDFGGHFADTLLQLYVFGVYRALAYQRDPTPAKFDSNLSESKEQQVAMLTRQKSICLIVTIPRSRLTVVSEKCIEEGYHSQIIFEVDIVAGDRRNTFSSIHLIFGKLTLVNGKVCDIVRDATGWFGSSDLHVCLYVPSYLFLETDLNNLKVVVRFKKEASVHFVFKDTSLGVELEIFKSTMDTSENIRLNETLPNLTAAAPSFTTSIPKTAPIAKEDVALTYPLLDPRNHNFTTRITLTKKKEKDVLSRGANVKLTQSSPCTFVVSYDQFEHACYFPFPVAAHASRLKVARKSGWIEICAEVLPLQIVSAAVLNPLPLTWDTNHGLSPWNAPYVNFNQLPRIAIGRNPNLYLSWLQRHLEGMLSDVELTQSDLDMLGQNYWFKHSIITIFKYIADKLIANDPISLVLIPAGDPEDYGGMLFFIFTGLYFDGNMRSVVIKGYVVEVNQVALGNPRFVPIVNKWILSGKSPDIRPEVFMLWKRALPVMAERCRDYPHVPACRFAKGVPALLEPEEAHVCGCGIGKVGRELKDSKYAAAAPFVTPVAISPLFHAGYIESTRHGVLDYNTGATRDRFQQSLPGSENLRSRPPPTSSTPSPSHLVEEESTVKKCKSCGKDGVKKCGGCGQVYYCSRKCQRNDWKRHKAECKRVQKEMTKGN
jgi:MYND finger